MPSASSPFWKARRTSSERGPWARPRRCAGRGRASESGQSSILMYRASGSVLTIRARTPFAIPAAPTGQDLLVQPSTSSAARSSRSTMRPTRATPGRKRTNCRSCGRAEARPAPGATWHRSNGRAPGAGRAGGRHSTEGGAARFRDAVDPQRRERQDGAARLGRSSPTVTLNEYAGGGRIRRSGPARSSTRRSAPRSAAAVRPGRALPGPPPGEAPGGRPAGRSSIGS